MLCIQSPSSSVPPSTRSTPKLTPNVLPCRINHSGPVNARKRYWDMEIDDEGRKVAYFRGRKLFGREVKLRDDYRGVVVGETDRTLPQSSTINNSGSEAQGPQMSIPAKEEEEEEEEEEELDEDETEPVKILEEVAVFDKIVVWGHEQIPDDEDIFVRGVEEWIDFAEAIHTVHDSQSEPSG